MLRSLPLIQAIHGYRETERVRWGPACEEVLNRVRSVAFPEGSSLLGPVHVLDLAEKGYIKPHVDSVKVGFQPDEENRSQMDNTPWKSLLCDFVCPSSDFSVLWQHHCWVESPVRQYYALGEGGCRQ